MREVQHASFVLSTMDCEPLDHSCSKHALPAWQVTLVSRMYVCGLVKHERQVQEVEVGAVYPELPVVVQCTRIDCCPV